MEMTDQTGCNLAPLFNNSHSPNLEKTFALIEMEN